MTLLEIEIPITLNTDFGVSQKKREKHAVRMGYYSSNWQRPSSTANFTIDSKPVFYNTYNTSKGFVLSCETLDIGSPGLNVDFSFRSGLKDIMKTPLNWEEITQKPSDADFAALNIGLWYNLYLGKTRNKGLFLNMGGIWSWKVLSVDILEDETSNEWTPVLVDKDFVFNFFSTIAYRF